MTTTPPTTKRQEGRFQKRSRSPGHSPGVPPSSTEAEDGANRLGRAARLSCAETDGRRGGDVRGEAKRWWGAPSTEKWGGIVARGPAEEAAVATRRSSFCGRSQQEKQTPRSVDAEHVLGFRHAELFRYCATGRRRPLRGDSEEEEWEGALFLGCGFREVYGGVRNRLHPARPSPLSKTLSSLPSCAPLFKTTDGMVVGERTQQASLLEGGSKRRTHT